MIDELRDKRQDEGINKVINNGGVGAICWPTGLGKTTGAIKFIKRFNKDKLIHVVVPTLELKVQWEREIVGLSNKIEIYVINTYLTEHRICDLLISDEAHKISNITAKVFSKLLEICTYKYILCMSATYTPEQILFLHLYKIPLVDTITVEEARAKNWISKASIYNLELKFNEEEQTKYNKYSDIITSNFPYFDNELDLVYKYMKNEHGWIYKNSFDKFIEESDYIPTPVEDFTSIKYKRFYLENTGFDIKDLDFRATQIQRSISARKALIYGARAKVDIIPFILEKANKKQVILFSETKKYAEEVHKLILNSVLYHSTLSKGQKEKALEKIRLNLAQLLCTPKALDEGLNIPNLKWGINASGTSTLRQGKQRNGRIGRYIEGEEAIMINLYMKNSVELGWLKKRQKEEKNVIWIKSVNEIVC